MRLVPTSLALVASAAAGPALAQAPPAPPEFAGLYAELAAELNALDQAMGALPPGAGSAVDFSAEFLAANCNRGSDLLSAQPQSYALLLDAMESLGIRAVTVTISYPFLLSAYHAAPGEREAYLDFYRRLAADIRGRGFKLVVKSHAMLVASDPRLAAFYAAPRSLQEYIQGRAEVARTIALELRPDYLSVQVEPDIEAFTTGQRVDTPPTSAALVRGIVDAVRGAGVNDVRLGAGMGTWQPNWAEHIAALAGTGIDYLDFHLYPLQLGFAERLFEMADLAMEWGKSVAMSEAWLYKIRRTELETFATRPQEIVGRDAYGFWEPLDRRFLELLSRAARLRSFLFVSPSWSNHFFAYLPYETARFLTPAERLVLAGLQAGFNAVEGVRTDAGRTYTTLAAPPRERSQSALRKGGWRLSPFSGWRPGD